MIERSSNRGREEGQGGVLSSILLGPSRAIGWSYSTPPLSLSFIFLFLLLPFSPLPPSPAPPPLCLLLWCDFLSLFFSSLVFETRDSSPIFDRRTRQVYWSVSCPLLLLQRYIKKSLSYPILSRFSRHDATCLLVQKLAISSDHRVFLSVSLIYRPLSLLRRKILSSSVAVV